MDDLISRLREMISALGPKMTAEQNETLSEALEALEAAREDAERLGWLDTQRGDDVQGSYPEEPQLVGHYWSIGGQCTDVRTAIDDAREARNG